MGGRESLEEFYRLKFDGVPPGLQLDGRHFNIFNISELSRGGKPTTSLRRDFYKIIFIRGNIEVRSMDNLYKVNGSALAFVNPDVPYKLQRLTGSVSGYYCIFKQGFFSDYLRNNPISLPLFAPESRAPYLLKQKEERLTEDIFLKISREIKTDYPFKYDLIRSYLSQLIHLAMKMEPTVKLYPHADANARITALFRDLLERQFPILSNSQQVSLRSATQFAAQLHIHVNHLNRAVRAITDKTTTGLIMDRLLSEAKALLAHTDFSVAGIGYCLGFEEVANFNHFFKKHAAISPTDYRRQIAEKE